MKTAAVADLKAFLSKYLSQVKEGEELLITDRGIPVAKIVPVPANQLELSARLLELQRAGLARIGSGKLPPNFWKWRRPKDPQGEALKGLLEEREEQR
jgi:prevent-host-death family protein